MIWAKSAYEPQHCDLVAIKDATAVMIECKDVWGNAFYPTRNASLKAQYLKACEIAKQVPYWYAVRFSTGQEKAFAVPYDKPMRSEEGLDLVSAPL